MATINTATINTATINHESWLESVHCWFNQPQELKQCLQEQTTGLSSAEERLLQTLPTECDILDIGCATGRVSIALAKAGHGVTGIDVAEQLIDKAQTYADEQELPVSYWVCDPTEMPFSSHSFDSALLLKTYCYVPESKARIAWLNEIARVLRPGGQLLLSHYVLDDMYDSYEHITEENQVRFPEIAEVLEEGDAFTMPNDEKAVSYIHYFLEADLRKEIAASVFGIETCFLKDTIAYYHLQKPGRLFRV